MSGSALSGTGRLSAALLVLAALFHVQWLAACEYMPMAGGDKACCASGTADHGSPCERQVRGHDCVTPFAKGASGIKLPERFETADPGFQDLQFASLSIFSPAVTVTARPPPTAEPIIPPDGRSLYLSSSRLRL